jgi:hypothetical protein
MIFSPGHVLTTTAVIAVALTVAYIAETRAAQRRTTPNNGPAAGSWEWDDTTDTREVWLAADQDCIDAAFLVIADASVTDDFADIIRRHAKGDQQ